MRLVKKNCRICFKLVLVDPEYNGEVRCLKHGGTAYMRPVVDEMVVELQPNGLIRVAWKQRVLGMFLRSEAEELVEKVNAVLKKSGDNPVIEETQTPADEVEEQDEQPNEEADTGEGEDDADEVDDDADEEDDDESETADEPA